MASRSRGSRPAAVMSAASARSHSRAGVETNCGTNVTMQTPPLPGSAASTSSGTSRGWSVTARHDKCVNTTGAEDVASASRIVVAATWERSTSMPIRFISRTTSRPNGASPPCSASSVAESAHSVFRLCVRVM